MNVSIWKRWISVLGVAALFSACELEAEPDEGGGPNVNEIEDGVFRINASSEEEWVFFDLDARAEAHETGGWDLAFQRSLIAANSKANVWVAHLDGVELEDVEAAPEEGYWLDGERPEAATIGGAGAGVLAFHTPDHWYDYFQEQGHRLAPKEKRVYVVLSDEGRAFAIQILDYYDPAGTPAHITFRLAEITPPVDPEDPDGPGEPQGPVDPEPGTFVEDTVDATDGDAWAYYDLDNGEVVDADGGWDIAFRHFTIVTNGPAKVAAVHVDDMGLGSIDEPPSKPFFYDDPEGEQKDFVFHGDDPWYDYDRETHELNPKPHRVYALQSTEGTFFAIQITAYDTVAPTNPAGHITFRYKKIGEESQDPEDPEDPQDPEDPSPVEEYEIDATDGTAWAYFDLDSGEEVGADEGWDIAFQHYRILTNGPEGVKVAVLDEDFDALDTAPSDGYLVDDPEDGWQDYAFQGESTWYLYDFTTHTVSPRPDRVYVVQSTEGASFAIQLMKYETVEPSDPAGFTTFRYKEIE